MENQHDKNLTIETNETLELGVTNEGEKPVETVDSKGEEGLVPKPGFEPGHPCGR